ncbi:hypothetical protein [Acidianus sp. HS-5]|uniref:hypothetical protein n=1 Tax=Acidianus sp. HS-5 TaxID=2886040 RepID=UPI001F2A7188|nr:hypothetical protein [Acidianus sp. HS-5]BDC17305.1 hypothetical protein HS5_01950 [Acidianus sp. HS-5]
MATLKTLFLVSFLVLLTLSMIPFHSSTIPPIKRFVLQGTIADPYDFIEYNGNLLEFLVNISYSACNITLSEITSDLSNLTNVTYNLYASYEGRTFYLSSNVSLVSDSLYNNCVLAVWINNSLVEYSVFNGANWSSPKILVKTNALSVATNGSYILVLCRENNNYHLITFRDFTLFKNITLPFTAQYIVTFNSRMIILSNISFSLAFSSTSVSGNIYGIYTNGSEKFEVKGLGLPVYCNRSEFVLANIKNNATNVSIYDDCGVELYNLHFNRIISNIFVQNNTLTIGYSSLSSSLSSESIVCIYNLSNGKAVKINEMSFPSVITTSGFTVFSLLGYVNCMLILENITSESHISKAGVCVFMYFTPLYKEIYKPSLPCKPEVHIEENEYPGITVLFINYTEPNYYSHNVSLVKILINGKTVCTLTSPSASIPFYIYSNGTYNVTAIAVNELGIAKSCVITTVTVEPNVTFIPKPELLATMESYPGYTLLNISYNASNIKELICVQLYINGSLVKKFTASSGYYIYNATSNGTYLVTLKVLSKLGSSVNSKTEEISVKPPIVTSSSKVTLITTTPSSSTTSHTTSVLPSTLIYAVIAGIVIVIAVIIILRKK